MRNSGRGGAADHQMPPKSPDIQACGGQPPKVEELRTAVRPVKVMHWVVNESVPCQLKFLYQLKADDSAGVAELDGMDRPASD